MKTLKQKRAITAIAIVLALVIAAVVWLTVAQVKEHQPRMPVQAPLRRGQQVHPLRSGTARRGIQRTRAASAHQRTSRLVCFGKFTHGKTACNC